jgi:hypothetical protein
MSVQPEGIQAAWDDLDSLGLDLTRACFQIGWELAHLGCWQPNTADPQVAQLTSVQDLSAADDAQVRVTCIGASLGVLKDRLPQNPAAPEPEVLDIAPVQAALATPADMMSELATFHLNMISACAWLEDTIGAPPATAAQSAAQGLRAAYEVGRLLALAVLQASASSAGIAEFTAAVCIAPGPDGTEGPAARAYSLLGGLRACLGSAAAYSVARHLEDWSDWVLGRPVDNTPGRFDAGLLQQAKTAIQSQGRVWRAILSGDALARDYVVASSYTDAANRLLVRWAASITAIARAFLRTALARLLLILAGIVLVVFVGAVLFDLLAHGSVTSGAKSGVTIAGILAAVASAGALFHVSRTQVTARLGDVWGLVEPAMLTAELTESIAISTRRLPLDTVGGASPPRTGTVSMLFARARRASLDTRQEPSGRRARRETTTSPLAPATRSARSLAR